MAAVSTSKIAKARAVVSLTSPQNPHPPPTTLSVDLFGMDKRFWSENNDPSLASATLASAGMRVEHHTQSMGSVVHSVGRWLLRRDRHLHRVILTTSDGKEVRIATATQASGLPVSWLATHLVPAAAHAAAIIHGVEAEGDVPAEVVADVAKEILVALTIPSKIKRARELVARDTSAKEEAAAALEAARAAQAVSDAEAARAKAAAERAAREAQAEAARAEAARVEAVGVAAEAVEAGEARVAVEVLLTEENARLVGELERTRARVVEVEEELEGAQGLIARLEKQLAESASIPLKDNEDEDEVGDGEDEQDHDDEVVLYGADELEERVEPRTFAQAMEGIVLVVDRLDVLAKKIATKTHSPQHRSRLLAARAAAEYLLRERVIHVFESSILDDIDAEAAEEMGLSHTVETTGDGDADKTAAFRALYTRWAFKLYLSKQAEDWSVRFSPELCASHVMDSILPFVNSQLSHYSMRWLETLTPETALSTGIHLVLSGVVIHGDLDDQLLVPTILYTIATLTEGLPIDYQRRLVQALQLLQISLAGALDDIGEPASVEDVIKNEYRREFLHDAMTHVLYVLRALDARIVFLSTPKAVLGAPDDAHVSAGGALHVAGSENVVSVWDIIRKENGAACSSDDAGAGSSGNDGAPAGEVDPDAVTWFETYVCVSDFASFVDAVDAKLVTDGPDPSSFFVELNHHIEYVRSLFPSHVSEVDALATLFSHGNALKAARDEAARIISDAQTVLKCRGTLARALTVVADEVGVISLGEPDALGQHMAILESELMSHLYDDLEPVVSAVDRLSRTYNGPIRARLVSIGRSLFDALSILQDVKRTHSHISNFMDAVNTHMVAIGADTGLNAVLENDVARVLRHLDTLLAISPDQRIIAYRELRHFKTAVDSSKA